MMEQTSGVHVMLWVEAVIYAAATQIPARPLNVEGFISGNARSLDEMKASSCS